MTRHKRSNLRGKDMERMVSGILIGWAVCALSPAAWSQPVGNEQTYDQAREHMARVELPQGGIHNKDVLDAMAAVPRELFLPLKKRRLAYLNMALPIGEGQYTPPPFVIASLTEQLDPQPNDKILEVGTGCGYHSAVLSRLAAEVYTVEIFPELAKDARRTFKRLKYKNTHVKIGDGFEGWPEHAPYDRMLVKCSPESVPAPLIKQLKDGGRMVIPVGEHFQQTLYVFEKQRGKLVPVTLQPTLFVPMEGKAEFLRKRKDPPVPQIVGGSFEKLLGQTRQPEGWFYLHQARVVDDRLAPAGQKALLFENAIPGQASMALQGFALDGRKVRVLQVDFAVKVEGVTRGQTLNQLPKLKVSFFDEKREPLEVRQVGGWFLSFDWTRDSARFAVPEQARSALLQIGLFGATGKCWFDDIRVKPAD